MKSSSLLSLACTLLIPAAFAQSPVPEIHQPNGATPPAKATKSGIKELPTPKATVKAPRVSAAAMATWLDKLKNGSPEEQAQASREMVANGDLTLGPLLSALAEPAANASDESKIIGVIAAMPRADADIALADLALTSAVPLVSSEALTALRKKQSPAARKQLLSYALKATPSERNRAVKIIRLIGDPKCVSDLFPTLEEQILSGDYGIAGRPPAPAGTLLTELTGQRFGEDINTWRQWWKNKAGTFRYP